jgi:hypothetical protein
MRRLKGRAQVLIERADEVLGRLAARHRLTVEGLRVRASCAPVRATIRRFQAVLGGEQNLAERLAKDRRNGRAMRLSA